VQGTAEAAPMPRASVDAMVTLALDGVAELCRVQREASSERVSTSRPARSTIALVVTASLPMW